MWVRGRLEDSNTRTLFASYLVAEWIHFTLFGTVLLSIKLKCTLFVAYLGIRKPTVLRAILLSIKLKCTLFGAYLGIRKPTVLRVLPSN